MRKYRIIGVVAILLVFSEVSVAQPSGSFERPDDWQVSVFVGHLSGDTLMETTVANDEPVRARSDGGMVAGVRVGVDREFSGIEAALLVGFSDLDLQADPAAGLSDGDADLYLGTLNLLWYPTGNELDAGRFRPFFTFGSGLGFFDSDFDEVDSELLYDVNVGAGFKLLTGDEGNPVIRLDWRWHIMKDFDNNFDRMYRQELSLGVGFRF